ncbi:hypothetical protein ES703_70145 [subsurface metagenome]
MIPDQGKIEGLSLLSSYARRGIDFAGIFFGLFSLGDNLFGEVKTPAKT